ncbi:helix-turn-helix transcriptional regulator [Spirosoma validum]|uniref:Helix-turn-helix transcriptional regulator n=1 Tax=Spirosoma validum TaxID=2771355 RepID=A0A927B4S0_9BACT|nr:AraC family transcriptional regulator [Spirosoma validum]MBD2755629.1 helix-turn-helix transcriptional regulator [Spirosoma validum]
MTNPVLQASSIFDPALMMGQPITQDEGIYFRHPEAGQVHVKNTTFPHLQVMNMHWQTGADFTLFDPTPADSISINFVLEGAIHSRFKGLSHELPMRSRTHNLIHSPESGHVNHIKGGQTLSMLLIDLKKDFFASSIGHSDTWSEAILNDLEHERPFSGVCGTQTITPQMLCLIDDIHNCRAVGPMRNLLIQSRVLELIALQIDQFRKPAVCTEDIPVQEVEKLYQLKAYLEVNFLEDHSLAQLSRFCALNEFKVKKGFKQLFDTTVFNYLRKLRMDYAGQLLRHHALSVDEVADRLGYEHSQHFSIAFKKFTGQTPSQHQHGRSSASVIMA